MNSIYDRLFNIPLGPDFADYFLLNLSRGLAGDLVKRICFCLGDTNTGKSTIVKACTNAFGKFVGTFNAKNFALKDINTDEAANLRWILLNRYNRLDFSNEIKSTESLDGNAIKMISSGGDEIVARNHCKGEETFTPHFMTYIMANDLNKIVPLDNAVVDRLTIFNFKRKFVDNPKTIYELKKDENLEQEIKTEKFKRLFGMLIIQRYFKFNQVENRIENIPKEIKNDKKEWIGDDKEIGLIPTFLQQYEITKRSKNYITNSELEQWLNESNPGTSLKKFGIELKKHLILLGIDPENEVYSKVKKIDGKAQRVWFGLLRKEDDL